MNDWIDLNADLGESFGRWTLGDDDAFEPLRVRRVEVLDVRFTMPDFAIVRCIKTVHDGRADTDISTASPSTGARSPMSMTRTEGSSRIALEQTTPSLAAGPAEA